MCKFRCLKKNIEQEARAQATLCDMCDRRCSRKPTDNRSAQPFAFQFSFFFKVTRSKASVFVVPNEAPTFVYWNVGKNIFYYFTSEIHNTNTFWYNKEVSEYIPMDIYTTVLTFNCVIDGRFNMLVNWNVVNTFLFN